MTQCSHCKQVLEKDEFPPHFKQHYQTLKLNTRTPIWTFSGLALFAVLVVWGMISSQQEEEEHARLIMDPQKGDVYEIRKDAKQYTLYKVDSLAGDTVFVLVNQYETNKSSGLYELKSKGDEAFIQEAVPLTKSDLKNMFDGGIIIDIERMNDR